MLATIVANGLLLGHLRAAVGAVRPGMLSVTQRLELSSAISDLGEGLDWPMAAKRDLDVLSRDYAGNETAAVSLKRITSCHVAALSDDSKLPALTRAIEQAPQNVADLIPSIKKVIEQKQHLHLALQKARSVLR